MSATVIPQARRGQEERVRPGGVTSPGEGTGVFGCPALEPLELSSLRCARSWCDCIQPFAVSGASGESRYWGFADEARRVFADAVR